MKIDVQLENVLSYDKRCFFKGEVHKDDSNLCLGLLKAGMSSYD